MLCCTQGRRTTFYCSLVDPFCTLEWSFDELCATAHTNIGFCVHSGVAEGEGVIQHPYVMGRIQDGFPCYFITPILDVALDDTKAKVGIHY